MEESRALSLLSPTMAGKFVGFLNSPKGKDSLLTTLTEGLSMLGMILTFRLAALASKQDLDIYVIVRRTVSFAFPVILMGAMVGLTRFVAMHREPALQRGYLRGAMTWVVPLSVVTMALSFLLAKPLAWALYGSYDHAGLVPPLALMTVGITMHGVSYGYLRGRSAIIAANFVQLMVLAIIPAGAFLLWTDMAMVLWATGIGWVGVPLLFILPPLFVRGDVKMRKERSELLRYGLPRVPGDVALGALLTIPGYVALRTHGLDMSGEVGFGATLLNLATAVFSPVALLLLPAAAGRLAAGAYARLEKDIGRMTVWVLIISVSLTVGFELLSEPLLLAYLGPTGSEYLPMARIMFIGALPFAFFHGMRSVLDAYFHTPRNGMNLMKAFALLLVGSGIHLIVPTPWYTMGVVTVLAMFYLGWLTWKDVRFVRSELLRLSAEEGKEIRVLLVVRAARAGGTSPQVRAQAEGFTRLKAAVSVFKLPQQGSPLKLLATRKKLQRTLAQQRPDVVYVQYGSFTALFTVLVSNVPVVVNFMGRDLDRTQVPGVVRPFVGGLFSQVAAFFASGIVCSDESVREHLWWRQGEAAVIPGEPEGTENRDDTLNFLRRVALH